MTRSQAEGETRIERSTRGGPGMRLDAGRLPPESGRRRTFLAFGFGRANGLGARDRGRRSSATRAPGGRRGGLRDAGMNLLDFGPAARFNMATHQPRISRAGRPGAGGEP